MELEAVGDGRYEASYAGFGPIAGTYKVSILAEAEDGALSVPATTRVEQRVGADAYEPDNTPATASPQALTTTCASIAPLLPTWAPSKDW